MQCYQVSTLSSAEKWTFEIKFDGYRCIAVKRGKEVTLFSRRRKVLNKRFPGVADAFASLDGDFVLDGELVALDSKGRPSFQILQNNLSRTLPVYLYCFDLLNRDGETLVGSPIEQRRDLLHSMFAAPEDPLRLSPIFHAQAEQVLEAVLKLGREGVGANGLIRDTNEASDQVPGSSSVRTWSKSSSLAVSFPEHADSMRCS